MIGFGIGVALALSFVLSGLEAAVLAASLLRARHRAGHRAGRGASRRAVRRAAAIDAMLGHRDRLLAAVTLANSAITLGAFLAVTQALVERLGGGGYLWAFAIWLPFYLLLFELAPKSLFRRYPYRMLDSFALLLRLVDLSLGSLLRWATPLRPLFGNGRGGDQDPDAFRRLTEYAGKYGALSDAKRELIRSVLDFRELTVAEVMLPLDEVTAVPKAMPAAQLIELSHATRLDQFPVMSETGDLVGSVDVVQALREKRATGEAGDLARPLETFEPPDRVISTLARLRAADTRLGGVCSPSGRPLGIVSIDDILQRLVNNR